MLNEVGFDEFESENDRASFATRGRAVGGFLVELKDVIVAVDAKSSVAEVGVFLKILLENFEIVGFGIVFGFGLVDDFDLVVVFSNRAVGVG